MGLSWTRFQHPEITPFQDQEPTFDPNYGFKEKRPQRVMIATEEEMKLAQLDLDRRDYCAHKLLDFRVCYNKKFPLIYRCAHEKHEYLQCEYQDFVLRSKEYERERRLRVREQRLLGYAH